MWSLVRPIITSRLRHHFFDKSWVYSVLFQKVLQDNADWWGGQSYVDPALEELTQCGVGNTVWISCLSFLTWWLILEGKFQLLCPFLQGVMFAAEIRALSLLCKGTIWYCPVRAQYRMFFRASSTSFWKHLSSFPGKESLPDVSILPCYFMCQSKADQKVTATERGKLYFLSYLPPTLCCSLLPLALIRCFNKLMYSTNLSDNRSSKPKNPHFFWIRE